MSIEAAERQLHLIASRLARDYPQDETGWDIRIVPLLAQATAGIRSTLLLLFGAVAFVLLLTCTNIANLCSRARWAAERKSPFGWRWAPAACVSPGSC